MFSILGQREWPLWLTSVFWVPLLCWLKSNSLMSFPWCWVAQQLLSLPFSAACSSFAVLAACWEVVFWDRAKAQRLPLPSQVCWFCYWFFFCLRLASCPTLLRFLLGLGSLERSFASHRWHFLWGCPCPPG